MQKKPETYALDLINTFISAGGFELRKISHSFYLIKISSGL